MSTNTKCEKCIFSDFSHEENPCAIGIIDRIKGSKTIEIDNDFNKILQYRCPFAFDASVYKENANDIGDVDSLKQQLYSRAQIDYYMIVLVKDTSLLEQVFLTLKSLPIKPQFISFVISKNNNTKNIIDQLKNEVPTPIKWKLHNLLEDYSFQETLDIVLETNTEKSNMNYFWVNTTDSIEYWNQDIIKINDIIVIQQPFLHAMYRKDTEGLFLTFNNYKQILELYKTDIVNALENIENKSVMYYG
jgi:hypothetical protein